MPRSAKPTIARRLRSLAGRLIRRLGVVPEGQPDGIGDDSRLLGASFAETVLAIYPDGPSNLYQLRLWLPTLETLSTTHPVAIVVQDSRVASALRRDTRLAVYNVASYGTFESLVEGGRARLALYPAHHTRNFQIMRRADLAHVYLGHGESDKAVSASNQLKAYDFTFAAGQAAIDRASTLPFYEAEERMIIVGRPQLETLVHGRRASTGPTTVLYAPTWEGGQDSMSYGSLLALGVRLVSELLQAGAYRVIFRPHPRTGISDPRHAEAEAEARQLVLDAAEADPDMGHRVSMGGDVIDDFNEADVLITDVSSLVVDWLPTGRPLIVTRLGTAPEDDSPALRVSDRLASDADPVALVRSVLHDGVDPGERAELVRYYLGDVRDPHAAFIGACTQVMDRHSRERSGNQS